MPVICVTLAVLNEVLSLNAQELKSITTRTAYSLHPQ